jgi:hypothetical protein
MNPPNVDPATANSTVADFGLRLPDCEPQRLACDLFHALSQPLTTLCCSLELALQQALTQEQYRECVIGALAQVERASWLAMGVRELLDAGEPGEDSEPLQLQAAVHDAVTDLLTVAESARVRICYLPSSSGRVRFEAQRLRRGLFHLVGFTVGWAARAAVVRIELVDVAEDVVLGLTVSDEDAAAGTGPQHAGEDRRSCEHLARRLGLGIARATFEAAGGSFRVQLADNRLSVEVRLRRV